MSSYSINLSRATSSSLAFSTADTNGDGTVSVSEAAAYLASQDIKAEVAELDR